MKLHFEFNRQCQRAVIKGGRGLSRGQVRAFTGDVARTNLTAIRQQYGLQQHGLDNVRSL